MAVLCFCSLPDSFDHLWVRIHRYTDAICLKVSDSKVNCQTLIPLVGEVTN